MKEHKFKVGQFVRVAAPKFLGTPQGRYEVLPFYPSQPKIDKPLGKGKAESYIVGLEKLVAEWKADYEKVKPSRGDCPCRSRSTPARSAR